MKLYFVSLFPEVLRPFLRHSVLGRAAEAGIVEYRTADPRDYCYDRHAKVDDTPFGGQPGMLIKAEPVALALEALGVELRIAPPPAPSPVSLRKTGEGDRHAAVILTDPAGLPFTQAHARELSAYDRVAFLCGHYEGFDDRVRTELATHAFSIGDYVLTNGEMPALTMADAIVRLIPGVLGSEQSLEADSHADGLLSAPNFTRPEVWRGVEVPAVLRSGDHKAIARWRRQWALRATQRHRPDLLARARLEKGDLGLLGSDAD